MRRNLDRWQSLFSGLRRCVFSPDDNVSRRYRFRLDTVFDLRRRVVTTVFYIVVTRLDRLDVRVRGFVSVGPTYDVHIVKRPR